MTLTMKSPNTRQLSPTFGVRIEQFDLATLDDETTTLLVDMLHRHRLLVLPDQHLNHADQVRISSTFGPLDTYVLDRCRVPGFPQILMISNIFENGEPIGLYDGDDEEEWHTDLSWQERTSGATFLYSVIAPDEGGATVFADTTAAYDELPDRLKARIEGLEAVHSMHHLTREQQVRNALKEPLTESQAAQVPDVVHQLVQMHPITGRRSLLLGSMVIAGLVGLDARDAADLLDELHRHATQPRYVYRHTWSAGDLVIWDNRATMHTASPCNRQRNRRLLYRTTVY